MEVKNLEFFDKNGYNLNLNWNNKKQIWEGNIFFPRVSVGLYENATIYVAELNRDGNDCSYTYPTGVGNIVFQWDSANSFVDEFFMFNFDADYVLKDTSSLVYTPNDGPICETLIVNRFDKYNVPLLGSADFLNEDDLLEIHVAFMANEDSAETTYKRTLVMSYENGNTRYNIARITFFAETIEEDERLKVWNENLGYNLKPEDTIIFKHSDIHEYMPDFELLNEKRKELMLEGHNIYPYIGGYKAIINAIKFFGYDNLNIVEYWRNINEYDSEYGQIYRTYVYSLKDRKCLSTRRKPISLDTKKFQKLSAISLAYNVNHPERNKETGEKYDEYGLPYVIEDFDKDKRDDFVLTIEEALVKLFALKKKLNDEFMPGSTKIIDVIGEGNYFGTNLIGNNPQISSVNYVESKGFVDFTVFPSNICYITENEDFARYIAEKNNLHIDETIGTLSDKTIAELDDEYDGDDFDTVASINEIDTRSLANIIPNMMISKNDSVCEYYREYYDLTKGNKYGDAEKYGLREMPCARNVYNDLVDDVPNDPYGENDEVPDMVICAKAILVGKFSDDVDNTSIIEWKITHPLTQWSDSFTGDVLTFSSVFVQLPYLGNYDVEVSVWDTYNHCSKKITKDAIIVKPYDVDIRGFYLDARPLPDDLKYDLIIPQEYNNEESKYKLFLWSKIDDANSGIITKKRNPLEMSVSHIMGRYVIDGDELHTYMDMEDTDEIVEKYISIVNTDGDGVDIMRISWIKNNADSDSDYNDDEFCGVDVFEFVEELSVEYDATNDSYIDGDLLYNIIKNNVDKMYYGALQEHLNVDNDNTSMRNYKPNGSVNFEGPYYQYDVDTILYRAERGYKEYDHLNEEIVNLKHGEHYKYVRYINSVVNIKPLTWVLLGFDQTRITGRLIGEDKDGNMYPKWTLTMIGDELDPNEDIKRDKIIAIHNGLYLTYLFENEGVYKVKLELKDINGNEYSIERAVVIVDKDANYEMYHTLNDEYNTFLDEKKYRNYTYM